MTRKAAGFHKAGGKLIVIVPSRGHDEQETRQLYITESGVPESEVPAQYDPKLSEGTTDIEVWNPKPAESKKFGKERGSTGEGSARRAIDATEKLFPRAEIKAPPVPAAPAPTDYSTFKTGG